MSAVVTWFGGAMVASMVLMLVVLVIRPAVARIFGPTVAYALWLLPALRMLLPSLPGNWVPGHTATVFAPSHMARLTNLTPSLPVEAGTDWTLVLLVVWAVGAAGFLAWQLLTHHVFMARSLAGSASLTRAAGIEVLQGPAIAGPMASGVLRRRILLPADFIERFTPEERRLALAHETAHHCRGDLIANLAGLAVLSLHWFNPFAHLAYRAFRDDQEAACDATVLGAESRESRHAYGLAILKSASCRVPGAACALNHAGAMKRRILIMIDGRKSRVLRFGGAALAAALVGGGLVATASTVAAPAPASTPASAARPHHLTFIEGEGDNLTITRNGHTRRVTPAERREIEHNIAQAEAARRIAERGAKQAERNLTAMLGDMPEPPAPPAAPRTPRSVRATVPEAPPVAPVPPVPPMPPVPEVSPVPPMPPVPPVPPRGAHRIAMSGHGEYSVDRNAIQAEVAAAMESARQAVAEARVQMAAARDEVLSSTQVRRMAMDEARADQEDALNTVAGARRDAAQARRDAAQARRDAAQAVRDARRERSDSI